VTDENSHEKVSQTSKVVMYATKLCPYCFLARCLLKRKGIKFQEISVSGDRTLWNEMEQKSGLEAGTGTVPQIFVNDEPLGGYTDIAALNRSGILDKKLENKLD